MSDFNASPRSTAGNRLLWCAVAVIGALTITCRAASSQECPTAWSARVVSVEGTVELRRADSTAWLAAGTGDMLCEGDTIRVQLYSRAALRLADDTLLRLNQNSALNLTAAESDSSFFVNLLRGIIHVISRDPRALQFTTPFANAGLEGTEFLVAVGADDAAVTVIEGEVLVSNDRGAAGVGAGQRAVARRGQSPVAASAAEPHGAAAWATYYAPLLAGSLPPPNAPAPPAQQQSAGFFTARAASRLAVGRATEARADIARARAIDDDNAEARALQALIALAHNDKRTALALAHATAEAHPDSAVALLALSHAQQAWFDFDAALATLEQAAARHTRNPLVWARLAELQLSLGNVEAGLAAATTAESLDPALPHTQTLLGFAALGRSDTAAALERFDTAIRLDPAAPLPQLGRGLALIRDGRLTAGRQAVETAVVLDPNNALLRSYAGKAYHDERREPLPATQLEMAKVLDPLDPTPWLYDAIRKQAANRPVVALRDLQQSIALNDRQPAYRSQLRLDEDLAARSASLGRIYRDLGFEQLALLEGWKSVNADPANHSAHRLLADTYSSRPRHQIARVNELFRAQLLQPLNVTPVPPQLGETNLFVLDTLGPSELAFSEFHPLFAQNGFAFEGAGVVGGNGTRGGNVAVAGLWDRLSLSLGQFHFETDGFRENNDLDNDVRNAFLQFRPNERTSLQAELRSTDTRKGDLRLLFAPGSHSSVLRQNDSVDSVRLGLRRKLSERADLIGALIHQQGDLQGDAGQSFGVQTDLQSEKYELQHLYSGSRWQLTSGVSYYTENFEEVSRVVIPIPVPPFELESVEATSAGIKQLSLYNYASIALTDSLTTTFGASADYLEGQSFENDQINPKLGVIWEPGPQTTVRAAAFRTQQGPFLSKENIQPRLEPTQVAGFNQVFFGSEGEDAWRYGIGIDRNISSTMFAGIELSRRDLDVPLFLVIPPSPVPVNTQVAVDERLARAYLYWTPSNELAVSGEYQYERFDNNGQVLGDGFARLRTHRLPLQIKYAAPSGINAALKATYVDQQGRFGGLFFGTEGEIVPGEDRFWVLDASLGYRLPGRRGLVALNVHNLLDQEFRFQDTDPENPRIIPERLIALRFTLAY